MINKDIIIAIQTDSQYNAIFPLLEHLKSKKNYSFDILVTSPCEKNTILEGEIKRVKGLLRKNGYSWIENPNSNIVYKIYLTCYLVENDIQREYTIGYMYGIASMRADTFTPERRGFLDGLFTHSLRDANIARAYCDTFVVPSLQFSSYMKKVEDKKEHKSKKTILFLPTTAAYASTDVTDNEIKDLLKKLKNNYKIIVKPHPSMETNEGEKNKVKILQEYSNKYVPPTTNLSELFEESDIVLTDYSSSFSSAIYCGLPVVVFYPRFKKGTHTYCGIKSWLAELIEEDIVPLATKVDNIESAVEEALSKKNRTKQNEIRKKYFTNQTTSVAEWIKIIDQYLNDQVSTEYILMKRYYYNEYMQNKNKYTSLEHAYNEKNKQYLESENTQKTILHNEMNPGIKTATKRLVKAILRKINRRRHND